jgi:RNA polymerase sigma-70 factor (ECF subfamily)
LIIAAQKGDLEAFEKLVRKYESKIRSFLHIRMRDSHGAEDLAQETFIIAYRKLETFDLDASFGGWLRAIAGNLFRNYYRKHRPKTLDEEESLEHMIDYRIQEKYEQETDHDLIDHMKDCVSSLKDDAEKLIQMRYIDEKSISEICDVLSKKHSAITMKLTRLRQQIKDCIKSKQSTPTQQA